MHVEITLPTNNWKLHYIPISYYKEGLLLVTCVCAFHFLFPFLTVVVQKMWSFYRINRTLLWR